MGIPNFMNLKRRDGLWHWVYHISSKYKTIKGNSPDDRNLVGGNSFLDRYENPNAQHPKKDIKSSKPYIPNKNIWEAPNSLFFFFRIQIASQHPIWNPSPEVQDLPRVLGVLHHQVQHKFLWKGPGRGAQNSLKKPGGPGWDLCCPRLGDLNHRNMGIWWDLQLIYHS